MSEVKFLFLEKILTAFKGNPENYFFIAYKCALGYKESVEKVANYLKGDTIIDKNTFASPGILSCYSEALISFDLRLFKDLISTWEIPNENMDYHFRVVWHSTILYLTKYNFYIPKKSDLKIFDYIFERHFKSFKALDYQELAILINKLELLSTESIEFQKEFINLFNMKIKLNYCFLDIKSDFDCKLAFFSASGLSNVKYKNLNDLTERYFQTLESNDSNLVKLGIQAILHNLDDNIKIDFLRQFFDKFGQNDSVLSSNSTFIFMLLNIFNPFRVTY